VQRLTTILVALAAVAFAGLGAAHAQAVGTYSGTQINDQTISFTVATDADTGNPEVTAVNFGVTATCSDGSTLNTGFGTGASQDIVGDKATVTLSDFDLYYVLSIKFAGSSASGTLTVDLPAFASVASGPPKKAIFCQAGKQTFTATLGGGSDAKAAVTVLPKAYVY